ncbi:hypothetical protein [Streptomyces fagopyri]|uniref:hypothetical protein n=1 Tax=Streptomyces fagopyri TaxID=2662397 RepID=UPI0037FFA1F2
MTLPHGLSVPLASLTDRQRAYVEGAPAGICTVTDDQVVRHATRPCHIRVATVRATGASQLAPEAAGKFAEFCPRRVVITTVPSVHSSGRLLELASTASASASSTPAGSWRRWCSRGRGGRAGTHQKPGGSPKPPTDASSPSRHPPYAPVLSPAS